MGLQAAKIHCNAFNWCKIIHGDFTVHLTGGQNFTVHLLGGQNWHRTGTMLKHKAQHPQTLCSSGVQCVVWCLSSVAVCRLQQDKRLGGAQCSVARLQCCDTVNVRNTGMYTLHLCSLKQGAM